MSCALSVPLASRLAATPTPAPQDSQVAQRTVIAWPGRSKMLMTGPQTLPKKDITPKRSRMYARTKAISTFGIRLLIATLKPFLRPVMKISKGLLLFLTCVAVALGIFEILLIESLEAEADKHAADKLEAEHHNQRNPNRNQEGHEKGRSNREVVVNQTGTCILPAGNNDQVLFSDLSESTRPFVRAAPASVL